ncbi:glyoxalase-like domain-containing protein [Lentinula raphanica]|uniref:Glyoxalase-like domain-containing protein n=1 Tax=Lentinula raphanica TaxID=153919 RepID=A0AA38P341_9AGAR|nr:glyoxalase-like domain-containing protein [Lentinula raphanica]KAJ3761865.1 glyoxalase-like domain-containing protein [Lentinula raphanica]KAJ3828298.1 glyoxalase-like domain-containing protein [Lentinula raphanica]KAJ3835428.1 glyoxalase-like domain-containing protein [Lentinula raphanica]KAJ3975357.1 glyoxalase-like domain-containing protein [Lentinula raphanica]
MALPSTKCLDHIIYLSPPGTVKENAEEFRKLGFNVLPGGQHADALTENSLIILGDGVYLELISFVKPVDAYPSGSPERIARENHPWALKAPGWIDYSFLGIYSEAIHINSIINSRAKQGGDDDLYGPEIPGGRKRPDGQILKWVLTPPRRPDEGIERRLPLPFFCADVTPRDLRVPSNDHTIIEHPCTAEGIAHVRFEVPSGRWDELSRNLGYIIGDPGVASADGEREWILDTVKGLEGHKCRLLLSVSKEEALGIAEVAFYVKSKPSEETIETQYAQIRFVPT